MKIYKRERDVLENHGGGGWFFLAAKKKY